MSDQDTDNWTQRDGRSMGTRLTGNDGAGILRHPQYHRPTASKTSGNDMKEYNTHLDQLIVRAFYWMDDSLQANIRKRGGPKVSHSQSMIIMAIGEGIRRPSSIADRLGVSRQAIHQSLRELIDIGLVELVPDPEDGRAKMAKLSRAGAPIQRMAYDILQELEVELGKRIGKRRVTALRDALEINWGEPALLD